MTTIMTIRRSLLLLLLTAALGLYGCKKEFLNKLPSTALVVPSTLSDYQGLLDNDAVMSGTPVLGEVSADNFYLSYKSWQALDPREYNAYVWASDIYQGQGQVNDWDVPYQQVFYANIVLEGLAGIPMVSNNAQQWTSEQGSALFIRAYAFWNVAQLFAPVYDSTTAATDLGIPLRLHSDVSAPSVRSSVADTYRQIVADLQQSSSLLPPEVPAANLNRPSKPAALAMLARVYLSMRDYPQAGLYADSALQEYDSLVDYNTLPVKGILSFRKLNGETIYQTNMVTYTQCLAAAAFPGTIVDSVLYQSYNPQDLRKTVFYTTGSSGLPNLKGSYAGTIFPFSGLATDDLYLIRAEYEAWAGNTAAALSDLNTLLKKRWRQGTFVPVTAATPAAARDSVLQERRKELAFRGLRWTDLRRLNKEGRNIILTRVLNGTTYQLMPNSNLYTLPIPPDVLSYNPNMKQNGR